MAITKRITRIHVLLETANDDLLDKVEKLLERGIDADESILTDTHKRELDLQEKEYQAGRGKTDTWQEIKQELVDKHGLQA